MATSIMHRARPLVVAALCGLAAVTMALPAGAEPAISGPHALPANVGGNVANAEPYGSMWCTDSSDCTLVGPAEPNNLASGNATSLTETSGSWSDPVAISSPANAATVSHGGFAFLPSLSCWSAGNCVAVGAYGLSQGTGINAHVLAVPMAVDEVDGVWQTAQQISLPADSNYDLGSLTSVSCDTEGDCTAVGFYETINASTYAITPNLIVVTQAMDTTTWSAPSALPTPAGSYVIGLPTAVSCSAATTCTAIAYATNATESVLKGEFLSEQSGVWSSVGAVKTVAGSAVYLASMSCPSAGDCVAVGATSVSNGEPVVDTESSGVWAAPQVLALPLLSPATDHAQLLDVSCLSITQCVAVGGALYGKDDNDAIGMVAADTGSGWSSTLDESAIKTGAATANVVLLGVVQCFSLTDCLTVGTAGTGTMNDTTHINGFLSTISATERVSLAGKPSHVEVTPGKVTTKVAFSAPTSDGGSRITYFTVTAKSKGESTRTCVTPGLSCTFKGAVKGKTYSVTVTARTKAGTSPPSLVKTFVAA